MKVRRLTAFVFALITVLGCMSVAASADNSAYIAPEGNDALFENSKVIYQSYTFAQLGSPSYAGVTRVKLEWEVSNIDVTYSSSKTWNPHTLTWDETKTVASVPDKTATFTLMNYSSEKVVGSVGFAVDADLAATLSSATFDENNGKTMAAAENDTPSVNVITATLQFNAAAFSDLAATTSYTRYGTYTVSIASVPKKSQTISAPAAATDGIHSSSITLTALASGHGATKYGVNTTDTAPSTWQDETVFTGLSPDTTYYFFAKYAGDDEYSEAVSEGTAITTKKLYSITYSINCGYQFDISYLTVSSTTIEEGETKSISVVYDSSDCFFDDSYNVTVANATKVSWTVDEDDYTVATLTIKDATDNVTVTIGMHGCFVGGTKISMADGTVKNIEDITAGDLVKAYDVVNGEFYTTSVNKVYRSSNTVISTITLSDGTQIQCTPNHPICTTDGFKSVDPDFAGGLREYSSVKMNVGDMVVTDHGTFAVSSIETNIGELVSVFNLSVESNGSELNNTFVANGVVAHNKPC